MTHTTIDPTALLADWTLFWNSEPDRCATITTERFTVHALNDSGWGADAVRDRAGLLAWRSAALAAVPGLQFRPAGRALLDGDQIVSRWYALFTGPDGGPAAKEGIDILRVEDGRIAEVWTVSGSRVLDPSSISD